MKKLLILSFLVMCGCAMINANSSFRYKTSDDWAKMTKADVLLLLENGADINEFCEVENRPPLVMASEYSSDTEVILAILDANPTEKTFFWAPFIKNYKTQKFKEFPNSKEFLDSLLNDMLKIHKSDVRVDRFDVEAILDNFTIDDHEQIATFCKKNFGITIDEAYVLDKISLYPLQDKKILKIYKIDIPRKDVVLTKIKSAEMNELRNSKEWYELVDEVKKLNIKSGLIGMSKENFVIQNGAPDKEYKVNQNTTILIYASEERKNIPALSNTSSISFNNGTFNNGLWNNVGWSSFGFGNSTTTTSGGYVKTDRWEDMVFVDKGIVTGTSRRDVISTK